MAKFKNTLKKVGKRFFNPKAWMSVDTIGNNAKDIGETFSKFFIIQPYSKNAETFEEVKARLGLSEEELNRKKSTYIKLALFFFVGCLSMLGYSFYCFWQFYVLAGFMSLGISSALLGFAFKYHFWFFQLKKRKLGCTFNEWLHNGLLNKSEHKRLGR